MMANKIRIMVDAGHCKGVNKSPCETTPKYYEGDMMWALHLRLVAELKKYGFDVAMTRTDIKSDLPVYNRGQKAKGYDMFVSLHSNTPGSSKNIDNVTDRPVIIVPLKYTDKLKSLAAKLGNVVHELIKTTQYYKDKPYQIYTKKHPDQPDKDYYGVIRGAVSVGCKNAIIIEHSFHTCEKTVAFLLEQSNLDRLAAKEAEIIADFFGVKEPEETPKTEAVNITIFKKGDVVTVIGEKYYGSNKFIPLSVKSRKWFVKSVSKDGNRVVIDKSTDGKYSICSAVAAKDLQKA